MSTPGKIRLKKSLTPSEQLINSNGYVVPIVNFNDSLIFTEIGNEDVISYDSAEQEWYFDINKLLPKVEPPIQIPDIYRLSDVKEGDSLIYDPITSKFVNSQLLNNSIKIISEDLSEVNSRVDSLEPEVRIISEDLNEVNSRVDSLEPEVRDISRYLRGVNSRVDSLEPKVRVITEDLNEVNSRVDSLEYTVNNPTPIKDPELQSQIDLLTSQVSNLMSVINSQQQIIENITPLGTPTFRYSVIDKEVPIGNIDGRNSTFFLVETPVPGSEVVYLNGIMQDPSLDYSLSENSIVFNETPMPGMTIRCNYRVSDDPNVAKSMRNMQQSLIYNLDYLQSPAYIYLTIDKEIPSGVINGINSRFELSKIPIPDSESVFLNGVFQEPILNYTIDDKIITFNETPIEGMVIRCSYKVY